MLLCMRWIGSRRARVGELEARLGSRLGSRLGLRLGSQLETQLAQASERVESTFSVQQGALKLAVTAAWVTGALAVLAGGLYAGREIRTRYKVKRRTPYDYYAHSGDRSELEFGVGI